MKISLLLDTERENLFQIEFVLMVASRDTGPYTSLGLPVINPWETPC